MVGFATTAVGAVIALILHRGQRQREALHAFDSYRQEILEFSNHAIYVMSRADGLARTDPDKAEENVAISRQQFFDRWSELLAELSSLIDRGRFFFPNRNGDQVGKYKGPANRGLRDPVLQRIIACHYAVLAIDYDKYSLNKKPIELNLLLSKGQETEGGIKETMKETMKRKRRDRNLYLAFLHLSNEEQWALFKKYDEEGKIIRIVDLIVSAKRSFVSEIFEVIQPRDWLKHVEASHGIELRSRIAKDSSLDERVKENIPKNGHSR